MNILFNSSLALPTVIPKLYQGLASNQDANTINAIISSGYGIKNAPTDRGLCILTLPYTESLELYRSQICIDIESKTAPMWVRVCVRGSWSAWRLI